MQIKYRVHEVAKDLGVSKKEIIDLLDGKFGGEPRKHATVLSEEELNVVFEHYTQNHQVENFDSYFASRDKKPEAPKQEAPKAEAPKQEAPKAEAPKQEAPKAEAPKQEAPKAEAVPKAKSKAKAEPKA